MTQKAVNSTSDERVVNNGARHQYRVLTDEEKALITNIKDKALELENLIRSSGESPSYAGVSTKKSSIAITNLQQATMWAVRGITN